MMMMMQGVTLIVGLLLQMNLIHAGWRDFPANSYYWKMTKVTGTTAMYDIAKVKADLHAVKFIPVKRLDYAASLTGKQQWIDVESGIVSDCLAFRFSTCKENAITISFWVRMRGGKRILATGSYTNSSTGPGVLLSYNAEDETMNVEFANRERLWQTKVVLRQHRWTHVLAKWTIGTGLQVIFDGTNLVGEDEFGKAQNVVGKPYNKMITIGRPQSIYDLKDYGDFDMAFLLFYLRDLADSEVIHNYINSLRKQNANDQCCTNKTVYENCALDPCGSRKCLNIERKFTECICPEVNIKKCESFPTDPPTTTPENCKGTGGSFTLNGCNNKKNEVSGDPKCSNKLCYYGKCQKNMGVDVCTCPACGRVPETARNPVCGSNHVTYENYCLLTRDACKKEKQIHVLYNKSCSTSLDDAAYYWPLDNIRPSNQLDELEYTTDRNGKQDAVLSNGVQTRAHSQLGKVLKFDGRDDFLDIAKVKKTCITNVSCSEGISMSFWMKYEAGDCIMAAGKYYESDYGPGFRMRRHNVNGFFELEVANAEHVWTLYVPQLPMEWFHFTVTWQNNEGLRVFMDGKQKLSTNIRKTVTQKLSASEKYQQRFPSMIQDNHRIRFAKTNHRDRSHSFGEFKLGHLAFWSRSLSAKEVQDKYKATVLVKKSHESCCAKKREPGCKYLQKDDEDNCICPDDDDYEEICPKEVVTPMNGCRNEINHCIDLIQNQKGYCENFRYNATVSCRSTCELCSPSFLASMSPQKHFSQETLIFSLLGCVGGLVLLLGVMFYFWKIYRTRYHGAFVPAIKSGSLTEVREFDDEKWPTKYIDSSEYFIKDVPPKKRALPLITGKTSQNNHRYQPPEFD